MGASRTLALLVALGTTACAGSPPPVECPPTPVVAVVADPVATAEDAAAIGAVLDNWHLAAAEGDEARYFAHFTPDAVFLGTDQTERWTVDEFRAYASPHFADGHGWTMRASRRAIVVEGDHAWFDEDLESEGLGPVRGSGVLRRTLEGWAIAHYVLSFTIPNERVRDLRSMLAQAAAPAGDESPAAETDDEGEPTGDRDD